MLNCNITLLLIKAVPLCYLFSYLIVLLGFLLLKIIISEYSSLIIYKPLKREKSEHDINHWIIICSNNFHSSIQSSIQSEGEEKRREKRKKKKKTMFPATNGIKLFEKFINFWEDLQKLFKYSSQLTKLELNICWNEIWKNISIIPTPSGVGWQFELSICTSTGC